VKRNEGEAADGLPLRLIRKKTMNTEELRAVRMNERKNEFRAGEGGMRRGAVALGQRRGSPHRQSLIAHTRGENLGTDDGTESRASLSLGVRRRVQHLAPDILAAVL